MPFKVDRNSKEYKDIQKVVYDGIRKAVSEDAKLNTTDIINDFVTKYTDVKNPDLVTTFLDSVVLEVAGQVDLKKLGDKIGALEGFETLADYISFANSASSISGIIDSYAESIEKMKKSVKLEDDIKLCEEQMKKLSGRARDLKQNEINKLREEIQELEIEGGKDLLDAMAGVVSNIPGVGGAYQEIIKKTKDVLEDIGKKLAEHNNMITLANQCFIQNNRISCDKYEALENKNWSKVLETSEEYRLLRDSGLLKLIRTINNSRYRADSEYINDKWAKIEEDMKVIDNAPSELKTFLNNGKVEIDQFKRPDISPNNDSMKPNDGDVNPEKALKKLLLEESLKNYDPNWINPHKYDPLVVDLENDDFDMANIDNGVHFDLDGDRLKEKTTWTSNKDGFLSIDLNDNGKIDNGAELFGDTFMLSDGKYAKSAIEALASLDKNRDGVIDAKDEVYSKLRIWKDENGNGISEDGELKSLADYNISSINITDVKDENVDINGSTLEKTISFERQEKIIENGVEKIVTSKGKIGEFLLERDIIDSIDEDILSTIPKEDTQSQAIIERIKKLPNIRALGRVGSLHNEMFLDKSGELLGLVEKFVNSTDTEEKDAILDKILIKLGKAENVRESQSGAHINAKFIKIMESFLGRDLEKGVLRYIKANTYKALYADLKLIYYSSLTLESVFKDDQEAFRVVDNKLVNIAAFNKYILYRSIKDIKNAGDIFDSASRVLLYMKSLGIEGFDEFKDYFGNISSKYIERLAKLNYKRFTGTDKSDTMHAYGKGSTIMAGDGDDKIEESMGALTEDDYFYGGKGNDNIYGSLGSDTYIFNLGDGQDIIRENVNGKDRNVIALGKGITKDNIIFKKINETDLEIKVRGTDDKITVKNQFGSKSAIDKVYFYDGGSLTDTDINEMLSRITDGDDYIKFDNKDNYIDLLDGDDVAFAGNGNDTIICGKGNDVLDAGNGNNTFIYNVGDGHDFIRAGLYGYNKIVFGKGIKKEDLIIARTRIQGSRMGIDEVTIAFKNNNNDSLKISSQQHSPIISLLQFADGSTMDYKEMKEMFSKPSVLNDFMEGTYKADTLFGLEGDDELRGYSGDDIIYGGSGDDLLKGGAGDDIIDGGIGNDTLHGEGGNDTYIFGRGYGVDRINDIGWNEKDDKDTILFKEGITKDDLEFTRTASDVLEIKIKDTNDKIILERLFDAKNGVEQFKFADGTVYKLKDLEKELSVIRGTGGNDKLSAFNLSEYTIEGYGGDDDIRGSFGDDILDGGTGNDILYGNGGNDTYIFGRGYGVDEIYDGGGGLDTIKFKEGISMDDLEFVRISSDVGEIRIKNSEDKIVLRRIFSKSEGVEQLKFADGTICKFEDLRKEFATVDGTDKSDVLHAYDNIIGYKIYAGAGNDLIYGGKHNDIIYGQAGDDTIRGGAGDDLIYGGSGVDTIIAEEGNDTLYGDSGNDQLYGREGNDILEGGEGNDVLYGGDGDDTYIFGRGDGVDTIHDAVGGFDTIQFKEGISKDDIEFVRTAHDEAELRIKGTDDKIILRKLFDSKEGVEQLQFSDGSIYKLKDIREELATSIGSSNSDILYAYDNEVGNTVYAGDGRDAIYGSKNGDKLYGQEGDDYIEGGAGNDVLYGGAGNDSIYGQEGDDYLEGGAGNDALYGGAGNDTYVFSKGDGKDTIYDRDSNPNNKDRIQLGYDILKTVFKRDGSNLCIGFADSTDTITINNWYSGSSYQIEEIKSSDNRSITNVQLQLMIDAMAAYTKDKGIDWNTAVKQNPNEVNSILQNFWVSNSN